MEEEEQRSSFWSTVPGILTGVAAVISAATGGYLAFTRMPNAAASDSPHIAAAAELKPAAIAAAPKEPSNSQESAAVPATPNYSSNTQAPAAAGVLRGQPPTSPSLAAIVDADVTATPSGAPRRTISSGQPRPSFDCARASTRVEDMLCTDADLAAHDRRAAALYFELRNSLPPDLRSQLLQSQKRFLHDRSDCSTSGCLSDLYDVRLRQLAEFDARRN